MFTKALDQQLPGSVGDAVATTSQDETRRPDGELASPRTTSPAIDIRDSSEASPPKISFRYNILPEDGLIIARFEGAVSREQLVSSAAIICGDDRYVRGFDGLVDLTEVQVATSLKDVHTLVDFTMSKRKHGDGKWAILVSSPAATAFAMLYQRGVADKHPFSIFCTLEGASAFLEREIDSKFVERALRSN